MKLLIRDDQEALNRKRMIWTSIGVVGQFQYSKIYEYNHLEFNEYLFDLGILPNISIVESGLLSKQQLLELKPFCIPGNNYLRYTLNQFGKEDFHVANSECNKYLSLPLEQKVSVWKETHLRKAHLTNTWKIERSRAKAAESFRSSKTIPLETGSLTMLTTQVSYCASDVLRLFGSDVLISCSKVNVQKMEEYSVKGYLKKTELKSFRRISDVQEKYYLMTLQREDVKRRYWEWKLKKKFYIESISNFLECQ
ncbi:hypothetical protein [Paenibacillus sp. WC2504]|uniref:hypothetical protein n=1 Tax=Paenibacillus sp. WC2504 TaxID=3461403 RepID=UPI0040461F36